MKTWVSYLCCSNSWESVFSWFKIRENEWKDKDEFYDDVSSNFYSIFNFYYVILFFNFNFL